MKVPSSVFLYSNPLSIARYRVITTYCQKAAFGELLWGGGNSYLKAVAAPAPSPSLKIRTFLDLVLLLEYANVGGGGMVEYARRPFFTDSKLR